MNNKDEFSNIVKDIMNNNEFRTLLDEKHHGITRYEHSMRVAKFSYILAKKIHIKKLRQLTRAALLHDFFRNKEMINYRGFAVAFNHPLKAYENACKYYNLTDLEKNIIESHMFPLSHVKPKYKESIMVSIIDKFVACYEYARYKAAFSTFIYILFIINKFSIHK